MNSFESLVGPREAIKVVSKVGKIHCESSNQLMSDNREDEHEIQSNESEDQGEEDNVIKQQRLMDHLHPRANEGEESSSDGSVGSERSASSSCNNHFSNNKQAAVCAPAQTSRQEVASDRGLQQQQNLQDPFPEAKEFDDVKQVELFGVRIVALSINGKERLCLAQISNTLLKEFSYNEIHNRRVALGITCVQCTPIQLEMLRRAGAMPSSSRRCGMITRREAERLCRSFLVEEQPPELPENFHFSIAHRVNYGCKGRFIPARYISSRAKCIECFYCGEFYSPNKFIFHSHRQPNANDCNPPDSPNINSWRKHIDLDWTQDHGQDIKYAWEDVKSLFNGGTRRRAPNGPVNIGSWTQQQSQDRSPNSSLSSIMTETSPKVIKSDSNRKSSLDQIKFNDCDQLIDVEFDNDDEQQPRPSGPIAVGQSEQNLETPMRKSANESNRPAKRPHGAFVGKHWPTMLQNHNNRLQYSFSSSYQMTLDPASSLKIQSSGSKRACNMANSMPTKRSNNTNTSNLNHSTGSLSQKQHASESICVGNHQHQASNQFALQQSRRAANLPTEVAQPFNEFFSNSARVQQQQHQPPPPNLVGASLQGQQDIVGAILEKSSSAHQQLQPEARSNQSINSTYGTSSGATNGQNFIYNQLYNHLLQSGQLQSASSKQQAQLSQPSSSAPSLVDHTELAMRHHIWSSILANLQCNTDISSNQIYNNSSNNTNNFSSLSSVIPQLIVDGTNGGGSLGQLFNTTNRSIKNHGKTSQQSSLINDVAQQQQQQPQQPQFPLHKSYSSSGSRDTYDTPNLFTNLHSIHLDNFKLDMKGPSLDAIRKFKDQQERKKREEEERKIQDKLSILKHRASQGDKKAKQEIKRLEQIAEERNKPQAEIQQKHQRQQNNSQQQSNHSQGQKSFDKKGGPPKRAELNFDELMKIAKQNELKKPPSQQPEQAKREEENEAEVREPREVQTKRKQPQQRPSVQLKAKVGSKIVDKKQIVERLPSRVVEQTRNMPANDKKFDMSVASRRLMDQAKRPLVMREGGKPILKAPPPPPPPAKRMVGRTLPRQRAYEDHYDDDEEEEDEYEDDDFIDDDDDDEARDELNKTLKSLFRYDRRKCDLREAELDRQYRAIGNVSTFEDLEREERRASRLAAQEDAIALRQEEERKKLKKKRLGR